MPRLVAVFILSIAALAQSKPAADLIITHAKVYVEAARTFLVTPPR